MVSYMNRMPLVADVPGLKAISGCSSLYRMMSLSLETGLYSKPARYAFS